MRAAPLIVLASTLAAAVVVRLNHPAPRAPEAQPQASLRSSPSASLESLPPALDVPCDKAVARGAPTMIHGDARHSHRAHGHVPARPVIGWTFHGDGPIEGQIVASPDEATLYVATLGGSLWALDRTGHSHFQAALGARAYATPCVAENGTIYVGTDGGAFFAIRPDGSVAWKLETPEDADTGAALLGDGTVVFAAGARVYGVRPDGVIAFRFQAKGKVFTAPALTPAVAGRDVQIVVGSQDDHVYGLTAHGELAWSTDLEHDVDGTAAIGEDGAIYVGTDGDEVVKLEADGRIAWRAPVGGYVRGSLSIARDGDVLAGVYGPSPRLVRLSERGILLGGFPVRGNGTRETGVYGGALEDDDGALAFGGQDGTVHVVRPDGKEQWAYDAHADIDAPLTLLSDGTLLAADYDGDIFAFGASP